MLKIIKTIDSTILLFEQPIFCEIYEKEFKIIMKDDKIIRLFFDEKESENEILEFAKFLECKKLKNDIIEINATKTPSFRFKTIDEELKEELEELEEN